MSKCVLIFVTVATVGIAHAEPEPPEMERAGEGRRAGSDQTFHTGLDVRTDLGTHHTRVPIGVRSGALDLTLVLDPMFALDGIHDMDLLFEKFWCNRIGVLAGWRWSAVDVADGVHHQQRSLVGVTAIGPDFAAGRVRSRISLELATLWAKHGGGAPTDWISVDRNLLDHLALGLFFRIEYAHPM